MDQGEVPVRDRTGDAAGVGPARWILLILLALGSWEIGQAVALQLVIALNLDLGIRLDSFDVGAMLTQVLRAVVSFVVAAPIALVLLRPILRLRA